MMASLSQRCMEQFLQIYESEPCLWKVKSKEYHDRLKKEAAYTRLIEKLREIEPNTNKETVLKKINSIRSSYRKEYKKYKASLKSKKGTNEVYVPKLWYFKLLRFLDYKDDPRNSGSNMESDEDETGIEKIEDSYELMEEGETLGDSTVRTEQANRRTEDERGKEPQSSKFKLHSQGPDSRQFKRLRKGPQSPVFEAMETLESVQPAHSASKQGETEFDVWAKSLAMQLNGMELRRALSLQLQIQTLLSNERLAYEMNKTGNMQFQEHAEQLAPELVYNCP